MKRKLFTIGYTGFSVQRFVEVLRNTGIECLIDTREIPISRKRGFAKSALQGHLLDAGIEYRHFRLLGSPRGDRHELRSTGDYAVFFKNVKRHLTKKGPQESLRDAIMTARSMTSCLMCCCSDWSFCHRSCVVDAIVAHSWFFVEHLELPLAETKYRKAA